MISKTSQIGKNVIIKEGCFIGENVTIEENVYIDYGCIIRDNVMIKKNSTIGARCILGEYQMDFYGQHKNGYHPLVIGESALIRSEAIIYGDTTIDDDFQCGHRVTIREGATIGNHVHIGTLSDVQGSCKIGNYVNLHSNVHIGQKSVIKDFVWIFPYVVLTNDPTPPSDELLGVTVESFAIISTGSIVLPGVHIDEDTLIGAGSIVNKDVTKGKVVVGNPGKEICDITKIKNKFTGEQVYPWRYTFDRGMPWKKETVDKWIESCNRQTDRQTDRIILNNSLCA